MNIIGASNLKNVIYPMTMEITSEFGSSLQVENELLNFMNAYYKRKFSEFKQLVSFFFKSVDRKKIDYLNPHEKKWLSLGIFLAIPLRQQIFGNQPLSNEDFREACQILHCDNDDPNIIYSFNRFEISAEKLCELLRSVSDYMNSMIASKLELVKLLQQRLREQNLTETRNQMPVDQGSSTNNTLDNIQMIESVIGQQQEGREDQREKQVKVKQNTPLKISFYLNVVLFVLLVSMSAWALQ